MKMNRKTTRPDTGLLVPWIVISIYFCPIIYLEASQIQENKIIFTNNRRILKHVVVINMIKFLQSTNFTKKMFKIMEPRTIPTTNFTMLLSFFTDFTELSSYSSANNFWLSFNTCSSPAPVSADFDLRDIFTHFSISFRICGIISLNYPIAPDSRADFKRVYFTNSTLACNWTNVDPSFSLRVYRVLAKKVSIIEAPEEATEVEYSSYLSLTQTSLSVSSQWHYFGRKGILGRGWSKDEVRVENIGQFVKFTPGFPV